MQHDKLPDVEELPIVRGGQGRTPEETIESALCGGAAIMALIFFLLVAICSRG